MKTDTSIEDLADADLRRLAEEARSALRRGGAALGGFSRYGVHDAGSLELWARTLDDELRRRGER